MIWIKIALRQLKANLLESILLTLTTALGVSVFLAIIYSADASISAFKKTTNIFGEQKFSKIVHITNSNFEESFARKILPYVDKPFLSVFEASGAINDKAVIFYGVDLIKLGLDTEYIYVNDQFINQEPNQDSNKIRINDKFYDFKVKSNNFKSTSNTSLKLSNSIALIHISKLQKATKQEGFLTGILLPKVENFELNHPDFIVINNKSIETQSKNLLGAFKTNILILVALTILVCAFLLYNSSQIKALKRAKELILLNTLGTKSSTVFFMLIFEVLLIGVLGSLIGLSFAYPLTDLVSKAFFSTATTLYLGEASLSSIGFSSHKALYLKAFIAGVSLTTIGAIIPYWKASNVSPSLQVRSRKIFKNWSYNFKSLALTSLSLLITCYLAYIKQSAILSYVASFNLVLLLVFLTPDILNFITRKLRTSGAKNINLFISTSNILSSKNIITISAIAGSIAVAILISMDVFIKSFEGSLLQWTNYSFQADLFIKPKSPGSINRPIKLDSDIVDYLNDSKYIDTINYNSSFETTYKERPITIIASNLELLKKVNSIKILEGQLNLERIKSGNSILVSESFKRKFLVNINDTVSLFNNKFIIDGIYKEYTKEQGFILTDISIMRSLFKYKKIDSASVFIKDNTALVKSAKENNLENLKTLILNKFRNNNIDVLSNFELKQKIKEIFDQTFEVTDMMRLVVMILAIIGFILTTVQQIYEKALNFKMLNTLGLSYGEIKKVIFTESVIVSLSSIISGIFGGLILSWIIVELINPNAFGWTLDFKLNLLSTIIPSLIIIFSYSLGSIIPVLRIEKIIDKTKLSHE